VKDHGLDPDTAERMLRGERTGPRPLADLLAAVTAEPTAEELTGEDAASAAFAAARSAPERRPRRAWQSLSFALKAAGALLALLAGGVTVAADSQHLPGPLGGDHPHHARTPRISRTLRTRTPSPVPSHETPGRSREHHAHCTRPTTHARSGGRSVSTDLKVSVPHLPVHTKKLPTPRVDGPETVSAPVPTDVSPSAEVSAGR
jgi:hypothetical protein